MVDTRHTYSGYAVVANKRFWDSLPGDVRSIVEGALRDATAHNNAIASKDTSDAWRGIKASGKSTVYVPTNAEREVWIKAMRPVQDEMAGCVGKTLVAAIRKELGGAAGN